MSEHAAPPRIRRAEIHAKVLDVDGTVRDIGVVAVHYGHPFRRALHAARTRLVRALNGVRSTWQR